MIVVTQDISKYYPITGNLGQVVEPRDEYIERLCEILPGCPSEVLVQWLYDHFQSLIDYDWLLFESLTFELRTWKLEEIPTDNFGHVAAVQTYMSHYFESDREERSQRMTRLAQSFINNGTWPVPPIFLEPFDAAKMSTIAQFPIGKPFHLVEGHNRMALLLGFRERNEILNFEHEIYLIKTSPDNLNFLSLPTLQTTN